MPTTWVLCLPLPSVEFSSTQPSIVWAWELRPTLLLLSSARRFFLNWWFGKHRNIKDIVMIIQGVWYHGSYSYWKDSIAYITYLLHIYLANYFYIFAKFGSQYLSWFVQICESFDLPLISTGFGELCPFLLHFANCPKINSLWLNFKYQFTPFFFFSGPPFFN